jgi:hypothetical protein
MASQAKIWKAAFSISLFLTITLMFSIFLNSEIPAVSAIGSVTQSGGCTIHSGSLVFTSTDGTWHGQTNPTSLGWVSCIGKCRYGSGPNDHCPGGFQSNDIPANQNNGNPNGLMTHGQWVSESADTAWCATYVPDSSCSCSTCLF